ncbi:pentapeptide repeat-containing protein [Streptomyces sp. NPDC007983]|uniref:pentapeptide repeat-containing protein n=1 Tax=Streptomyces sp. NPDC007983 TaxID=3364800 RepID=UPI0036E65AA9
MTLDLPNLDEPGLYLSNVQSLEGGRGGVQAFRYADADVRALDLTDSQLVTGRITALRAASVHFEGLRLHSIEIDGCQLASACWRDCKISRVRFRDCKMMGAALTASSMDNVLFENCKLDYATFENVRATGPVVFSECVLTETSFIDCDLSGVVLDSCAMRLTGFTRGQYRGLDLRGNDLSTVRGVPALAKVIIDRAQRTELTEALLGELDVTYGEDLEGNRRPWKREPTWD